MEYCAFFPLWSNFPSNMHVVATDLRTHYRSGIMKLEASLVSEVEPIIVVHLVRSSQVVRTAKGCTVSLYGGREGHDINERSTESEERSRRRSSGKRGREGDVRVKNSIVGELYESGGDRKGR